MTAKKQKANMRLEAARVSAVTLAMAVPAWCWGQTQPADGAAAPAAATRPASRPTSSPALTLPPGSQMLEAGGRKFIVFPEDADWVRQAAEHVSPATMPSTMPADLLEMLGSRRDLLISGMARDSGIDAKVVDDALFGPGEKSLRSLLEKYAGVKVKMVFLVAPHARVRDAMAAGWTTPVLKYNRAMNEVLLPRGVILTDEENSAFALQPMILDPKLTDAERGPWVSGQLSKYDAFVARNRAETGEKIPQVVLIGLFGSRPFEGLKFTADQEWLKAGITGALTAKYLSPIIGRNRRDMAAIMSAEPRSGIPTSIVDLLHPMDTASMRREAVPAYGEAFTRKSIRVMDQVMLRAGDDVCAKLVAKIREAKPADGAALVELVKEVSRVDVAPLLKAGQ